MESAASVARRMEDQRLSRWFCTEIQVHETDLRSFLRSRFSSISDPEDILQECYARLIKQQQAGPVPITRAYLFVVARNVALDLSRRKRIVAFKPLDQSTGSSVVEESAHVADQLCRAEELKILDDAIQSLPDRCREILILRRLHGHSYRDIGRRLQISEATVHAQVVLGLKRCRHYLCAHGVSQACLHDDAS